jgi:hypothetical protein
MAWGVRYPEQVCAIRVPGAPLTSRPSGPAWYKGYDSGTYNHFICQNSGAADTVGSVTDTWWIYGRADNGLWGWLNEAYLVNAVNYGYVAGLDTCLNR